MLQNSAQWSEWCTEREKWAIEVLKFPLKEDVQLLLRLIRKDPEFLPKMSVLLSFSHLVSLLTRITMTNSTT